MPLPSSGAISLNQMHVEVGGTSGTTCSLNDSDIRGLIPNRASGALSRFSDFHGRSAVSNWSATMTVGTASAFKVNYYGYGLVITTPIGSLTDTTVDNLSGAPQVANLRWNPNQVIFSVGTGNLPNSGFTTLTIGSSSFSRSSATYSTAISGQTQWVWSTSTNPFGTTSGATRSISMV